MSTPKIIFPPKLFPEPADRIVAEHFAKKATWANSYAGAFRGELAEICLNIALQDKYIVEENDEEKTKEYEWDLKVDGVRVDVKTTSGKYITIGSVTLLSDYLDKMLFPCYESINGTYVDGVVFHLIGVLTGNDVMRLAKPSRYYSSHYIPVADVWKNSIQKVTSIFVLY